jgi:hypothetical protein
LDVAKALEKMIRFKYNFSAFFCNRFQSHFILYLEGAFYPLYPT